MIYLIVTSSWDEKDTSNKEEINYFLLPIDDSSEEKSNHEIFNIKGLFSENQVKIK